MKKETKGRDPNSLDGAGRKSGASNLSTSGLILNRKVVLGSGTLLGETFLRTLIGSDELSLVLSFQESGGFS